MRFNDLSDVTLVLPMKSMFVRTLQRMLYYGNAALIGVAFHHVHLLNEKVLPRVL